MQNRYATSQILLHWLTLLLLIIVYATMEFRGLASHGSWQRSLMVVTHFSAGTTVLLIILLRLWLRTRHRTPAIVPPLRLWMTAASHLLHTCLYGLFILLPVLGISSRYLRGKEWMLFGISMPVSTSPLPELAASLTDWHETLAPVGYWLVGIHALAALSHHYLFRDNTLLRMMPFRQK
ncbi:cytochrome b561 [Erwinia mallotivora]|uniref:cytochrome b561 n=1 Tax=Erwinia mallotivora TaxID=69222 RepID=UPI0035E5BB25